MTYREKLEQLKREGGRIKRNSLGFSCPGNYWPDATHCGSDRCVSMSCNQCWNQEAPDPTKRLTSEPPNCGSAAQTETPTYRRMSEPPKPTPPKRRKVVYIAGPITGVAKYWEPFEEMAEEVRAAGYIPLIPTWQPEGLANAQYMRMCMAMLDAADAVLLLPGWRDSIGATIEAAYAAYVDKPVAESIEKLKEVLSE